MAYYTYCRSGFMRALKFKVTYESELKNCT